MSCLAEHGSTFLAAKDAHPRCCLVPADDSQAIRCVAIRSEVRLPVSRASRYSPAALIGSSMRRARARRPPTARQQFRGRMGRQMRDRPVIRPARPRISPLPFCCESGSACRPVTKRQQLGTYMYMCSTCARGNDALATNDASHQLGEGERRAMFPRGRLVDPRKRL